MQCLELNREWPETLRERSYDFFVKLYPGPDQEKGLAQNRNFSSRPPFTQYRSTKLLVGGPCGQGYLDRVPVYLDRVQERQKSWAGPWVGPKITLT